MTIEESSESTSKYSDDMSRPAIEEVNEDNTELQQANN